MPVYVVQIGIFEDGEETAVEDEYEAGSRTEALDKAREDYPGSMTYVVIREK